MRAAHVPGAHAARSPDRVLDGGTSLRLRGAADRRRRRVARANSLRARSCTGDRRHAAAPPRQPRPGYSCRHRGFAGARRSGRRRGRYLAGDSRTRDRSRARLRPRCGALPRRPVGAQPGCHLCVTTPTTTAHRRSERLGSPPFRRQPGGRLDRIDSGRFLCTGPSRLRSLLRHLLLTDSPPT